MMASKTAGEDGVDIAARQLARLVAHAGVHVQRAAAALALRHHHLAAVRLQHAHRGLIQAREADVGDASGQKRHAILALALRRKRAADLAEEERRLGRRRELFADRPAGPAASDAQPAHQRLESADLVKVEQRAGHRSAAPRDCSSCTNTDAAVCARTSRGACALRFRRAHLPPCGRSARPKGRPIRSRGRPGTDRCARGTNRRDRRAVRPPAPSGRRGRAANPSPGPVRDRWGRRSDTGRNVRSGPGRTAAVPDRSCSDTTVESATIQQIPRIEQLLDPLHDFKIAARAQATGRRSGGLPRAQTR